MTEQPYGNMPLFRPLDGEEIGDQEATEIESLCTVCEEKGMTRLLLTKIPFYKEVVIMSFSCPHCGNSNNEVQPGGPVQEQGSKTTLTLKDVKDLNRQVVKSDSAIVSIPHLELEIPAKSQKGVLTTIEGIIDRVVEGLRQDQPVRKALDPENAEKIEEFIKKLEKLKVVEEPFQMILDDPSGNSFIENPAAPGADPALVVTHYQRTEEQNLQLGLMNQGDQEGPGVAGGNHGDDGGGDEVGKDEVLTFPTNCSNCNAPAETRMKVVDIPFFKEVVIMATNCEVCGCRSNEVKSGSGVEAKGRRMTLNITDHQIDMSRDVLKSETCAVSIPELELESEMGTMGGKFTTVEGLLKDIQDHLGQINPFALGDSAPTVTATSSPEGFNSERQKLKELIAELDKVINGERKIHLVLDDPAGNSYMQNVYAPDPDPELLIEEYQRSYQQNDDLGLNQMKTENYEGTQ